MSTMSTRRSISVSERPARLPGHQRREHLLDVAAQLVVEEGLDAVTMEGIAARAGVSKGLGYAYFRNRDELLLALYDREVRALDERVTAALVGARTLEEKLRLTLTEWFAHLYERGEIVGTLIRAQPSHGPVNDRRRERHRALELFWTEMVVDEYPMIPKHVARAIAAATIAGAGGMLESWVRRKASRSELIPAYTAFVMGGLAATAAAFR
jgi:AcrR family transcriptional regulator